MGGGSSSSAKVKHPEYVGYDHFHMDKQVGEGGFGKVNAVTLTRTGADYAMKTLSKKTIRQTKNVDMIRNERNILEKLDSHSKWIAGMHFAFQNHENCYLVLTLALGGDLRYHYQHMEKGKPLAENRMAFYTRGIVLALQEIHSARIIHRDIKPANVVINKLGYPVVTDFGISKVMDEDGYCYGSSGTRMFMPPEALKNPHKQNKLADTFSLAVMVMELTTGKKPSKGALISSEKMASTASTDSPMVDFDSFKVSEECRDFLKKTLIRTASERLDTDGMLKHAWLSSMDTKSFDTQTQAAPWKPGGRAYCVINEAAEAGGLLFDDAPDIDKLVPPLDTDYGAFKGYDYNCSIEVGEPEK